MGRTAVEIEEMARNIRICSLKAIHAAGSGHPGGCLSCADILAVLYGSVMRYDVEEGKAIGGPGRDRFILSKGHAAPALYAALAEVGVLEHSDLLDLRKIGSKLQGHPWIGCPGIETSTGSLGQGLSVAVGMAYGLKKAGMDSRVFVLVGDGELQEGICWEAMMIASKLKLNNLYVILDANHLQSDEFCERVTDLYPVQNKVRSFGFWDISMNGHSCVILKSFFEEYQPEHPTFVVAETRKGKGVSFMENRPEWHGSVKLSDEQLGLALEELSKQN